MKSARGQFADITLEQQFVLAFVLVQALTTVILVLGLVYTEVDQVHERLHQRAIGYAQLVSGGITDTVATGVAQPFHLVVERAERLPDMAQVTVLNSAGVVLAAAGESRARGKVDAAWQQIKRAKLGTPAQVWLTDSADRVELAIPARWGTDAAWVHLALDGTIAKSRVSAMAWTATLIGLIAMLVGTLVALVLARRLASLKSGWLLRENELAQAASASDAQLGRQSEALRELSDRFRAIVTESAEGMTLADMNGKYHLVNPAFCAMTGYSEAELLQMTVFDLLPPGLKPTLFDGLVLKQVSGTRETQLIRKDGSLVWARIAGSVLQLGDKTFLQGMVEDISARKEAEQAFAHTSAQLNAIIQGSLEGIALMDSRGNYLLVNPAFCAITGYSETELLAMSGLALLPGPTDPNLIRSALTVEKGSVRETQLRRKDGSLFWARVSLAAIETDAGRLNLNILSDSTERRMAAVALANSEARLRAIFAASLDGYLVLDLLSGTILEVNDPAVQMIRMRRDQIVGQVWIDLSASEQSGGVSAKDAWRVPLELAIVNRRARFDWQLQRGDGSVCWVDVQLAAITLDDRSRLFVAVRDLSERKALEEGLLRSNRELEQFAYLTSHDLQEPLRSIGSFAQLLSDEYAGQLSPDADQYLGYITAGAERMKLMINDLLAYSRITSKKTEFKVVEIAHCVQVTLESLRDLIDRSDAQIVTEAEGRCWADAGLVTQVLQNFVRNAITYTKPGQSARVEIRAKATENAFVVTVRDEGIGIEERYFAKIFQVFRRLHSTSVHPGTGIGLAACQKIAARLNGRIGVESVYGQGSTFSIALPLPPERAPAVHATAQREVSDAADCDQAD